MAAPALALFWAISPLEKLLAKLRVQSNGQIVIVIVIRGGEGGGGGGLGGDPPPPPTISTPGARPVCPGVGHCGPCEAGPTQCVARPG